MVLGLKTAAWLLTGSAALFSDAAETVVNVAASAAALWALRVAARPADANHPYGHAKAEFFAAVAEGGLVVAAAGLILQHAWQSWQHPVPMQSVDRGLALNVLATVLNAAWAWYLQRVGVQARSPALIADARHLWADVVTSVAIVTGVVLVLLSGVLALDAVVAALAAGYILWSGVRTISQSLGGLMDEAPAPAVVERIRTLVAEHAEGALEAHDLRTRHAGRATFLQFHLVVPGSMTVAQAHVICDRIEDALEADIAGLVVTIHVEPEGKAKHHGVLVL